MSAELIKRAIIGIVLCMVVPYFVILWVVDNLELNWWNIFMVSGLESLWVYLCWDISRWIIQEWRGE